MGEYNASGFRLEFFYTSTVHCTSGISVFCRSTFTFSSVHFHIFVGPLSHFRRATFTFSGHFCHFHHRFSSFLSFLPLIFLPFCLFWVTSGQFWSHRANFGHIRPIWVTSVQYESQRANMPAPSMPSMCKKALVGVT